MQIQDVQHSHWTVGAVAADSSAEYDADGAAGTAGTVRGADGGRTSPLRVDAQRNLEHVLRAAREVFGEVGYGAPMEDVARRARVGVGTVYRRFPSKDVLVRRIAEEETDRLTEQARAALGEEDEPWPALSRFLRTSVHSGAGRLLPPQILRVGSSADGASGAAGVSGVSGVSGGRTGVPQQRPVPREDDGPGQPGLRPVEHEHGPGDGRDPEAAGAGPDGPRPAGPEDDGGAAALLGVVGQLVERARAAGDLRTDVTVEDVLLVIATAAPSLPDPVQQAAASARLLDILLEGLRPRS